MYTSFLVLNDLITKLVTKHTYISQLVQISKLIPILFQKGENILLCYSKYIYLLCSLYQTRYYKEDYETCIKVRPEGFIMQELN